MELLRRARKMSVLLYFNSLFHSELLDNEAKKI